MRKRLIDNLYVGTLEDCAAVRDDPAWSVVHACKHPCFQAKCGQPKPEDANYLAFREGQHLYLNCIDPVAPLFQRAMFDAFLEFMRVQWEEGRKILVHCNKGESRAPTLCLLFLAKVLYRITAESFDDAWDEFELLAGEKYHPSKGIETWMREHWHEFNGGRRLPSMSGASAVPIPEVPVLAPEDSMAMVRSNPLIHFAGFTEIETKEHVWATPIPNRLQFDIAEAYQFCIDQGIPCRLIMLKPRQVGCSTFCAELCYHHMRRFHSDMIIMGDVAKRTEKVWQIFQDIEKHDAFSWDSTITVANTEKTRFSYPDGGEGLVEHDTALDPKAGISGTRQVVWLTEAARYMKSSGRDKKVITAVLNSLPQAAQTLGIAESTPEGANGWFYETWQQGATLEERKKGIVGNGWIKVFAPWFTFTEHKLSRSNANVDYFNADLDDRERRGIDLYQWTPEQIAWRRMKIKNDCGNDSRMFDQDFAEDAEQCIEGGERVATSRGIIPIREVRAGDITTYGTVIEARSMGEKKTVILRTKLGYEVRCTSDHRIAKEDGTWAQAKDTIGETIRLQPPFFSDTEHEVVWSGFAGVEKRLRITEEWAHFLGYYMGDGSFCGDTLSIIGCAEDNDVVLDIGNAMKTLFGDAKLSPAHGGNAFNWRLTRKDFEDVFVALGIVKVRPGYRNKVYGRLVTVPDCIWRSPKSHVRLFLQTLFEADGWSSATKNNVKFFTCYEAFCRDVQLLLLGFGIHACKRRVVKKVKDREYVGFELVLYSLEALKFNENIGFISQRKRGRGVPQSPNGRKPQVYDLRDTVESITDAEVAEVFDLQISDHPQFGAGGILVHNCFLASGRPRFDLAAVAKLEKVALVTHGLAETGVLEPGEREGVNFMSRSDGESWLWCCERPTAGCSYLGFVDPCMGEQGEGSMFPDAHAAGILRAGYFDDRKVWHPVRLVAAIDVPTGCRWDDEVLAERMKRLLDWYGGCEVIPEIGNGLGVLNELRRAGCVIYQREKMDNMRPGEKLKVIGWDTNADTRPIVVNAMANAIRNRDFDCSYLPCIKEMKTFIINDRGKACAKEGCHDDWIMGPGIALANLDRAAMLSAPTMFPPNDINRVDPDDPSNRSGLGPSAFS